uniref:Uncharacterized protein n=1 Tax=Arundo donax TaxID=35708 RepID=A0A0A9H376_ARUDO
MGKARIPRSVILLLCFKLLSICSTSLALTASSCNNGSF